MNREQRRKQESKIMREQHISRENAKKLVYLSEIRDRDNAPDLPDGTAVKIDAAKILASRGTKNSKYLTFVKENRDKVFHVSRDDPKANASMVVLDGDETEPRWLWWCGDLIAVKDGDKNGV